MKNKQPIVNMKNLKPPSFAVNKNPVKSMPNFINQPVNHKPPNLDSKRKPEKNRFNKMFWLIGGLSFLAMAAIAATPILIIAFTNNQTNQTITTNKYMGINLEGKKIYANDSNADLFKEPETLIVYYEYPKNPNSDYKKVLEILRIDAQIFSEIVLPKHHLKIFYYNIDNQQYFNYKVISNLTTENI